MIYVQIYYFGGLHNGKSTFTMIKKVFGMSCRSIIIFLFRIICRKLAIKWNGSTMNALRSSGYGNCQCRVILVWESGNITFTWLYWNGGYLQKRCLLHQSTRSSSRRTVLVFARNGDPMTLSNDAKRM